MSFSTPPPSRPLRWRMRNLELVGRLWSFNDIYVFVDDGILTDHRLVLCGLKLYRVSQIEKTFLRLLQGDTNGS